MVDDRYKGQLRGDRGAYERYLAGMDSSMQQKVALTAAHLLGQGRIADMGMGSGTGSDSLAALYPGLDVIGVDVSPQIVDIARERYQRPNLSFRIGDIAQPVFEKKSLQAIVNSSVLHHVTSFNGYDRDAARRALEAQVEQLDDHGVLIVRDFLDPGDDRVFLEVPSDDGDDGDDPATCSTARLVDKFAAEFKSLCNSPGAAVSPTDGAQPGWQRFATTRTLAVEFLLRKDYRRDWETEIKEEYTYLTQQEFERTYATLGLRVLASTPIRNPWIVRNRFAGKFRLLDERGQPSDEYPATNYLVVGERVPDGAGVRLEETPADDALGFLRLDHYAHRTTGHVMDLVSRPHLTVDAVPWFEFDGDIFVLARMSYPRPVLRAMGSGVPSIDGSRAPDYITEPLTVVSDDAPIGQTIEDALWARASIPASAIIRMQHGSRYFPSPGGLREEVRSMFVELKPTFTADAPPQSAGYSDAGRIGAVEARQLLRAAQVGGLPDARLELNVYDLLRRTQRTPGPWIGEKLELPICAEPPQPSAISRLAKRPARRVFERCGKERSTQFLELRCSDFVEYDAAGTQLATKRLEFVVPRPLSANTVAVALLCRTEHGVLIGLDDDDLPAAQSIDGNSNLLVTPAWRLPREVSAPEATRRWIRERIEAEYGLELGETWWLGGRYHPSPGSTPEVVHPLAAEVRAVNRGRARPLHWVDLHDLCDSNVLMRDGHLRVVAERSAHATTP